MSGETMSGETLSSERKKYYLSIPRLLLKQRRALCAQIEELRESALCPSQRLDGMPHGSGSHGDLSGYVSRLCEQSDRVLALDADIAFRREQVREYIERLSNAREREVLHRRYLYEESWEEISGAMGCTPRHAMRLHGWALQHLDGRPPIPDPDKILND